MNLSPFSLFLQPAWKNVGFFCLSLALSLMTQAEEPMNPGENVTDAAVSANPSMQAQADVPDLPRVLIIGDSISIGYTKPLREMMAGKANIHRIPVNGQSTAIGLKKIDSWLGSGPWDVIHFNFGLHDAKYLPEGVTKVERADYEKNLQQLITRMRETGATLIFATTTPVPQLLEPPDRRFDNIAERNRLAVQVMEKNDVQVNDLYAAVLPVQDSVLRPKDVHFTPEGYELLAKAVATSIEKALSSK